MSLGKVSSTQASFMMGWGTRTGRLAGSWGHSCQQRVRLCVCVSVSWLPALMQGIIPGPLESYELTYSKIYIDAYKLYPSKTDPEFNLEHIGRKWSQINCVWTTVPCNPTRPGSWTLAQHRWAVSPDETLLRSEMHLRMSKGREGDPWAVPIDLQRI